MNHTLGQKFDSSLHQLAAIRASFSTTWFILSWEENNCCQIRANSQNDNFWPFWVKIVVILWICSALTAVVIFLAWDNSRDLSAYSSKLEQMQWSLQGKRNKRKEKNLTSVSFMTLMQSWHSWAKSSIADSTSLHRLAAIRASSSMTSSCSISRTTISPFS